MSCYRNSDQCMREAAQHMQAREGWEVSSGFWYFSPVMPYMAFKTRGTRGEMYHKTALDVVLPTAQTINCKSSIASFSVNRGRFFFSFALMQLHGFQRALEVVSGSACSVKHIWLISQVWKHWITILSVLWKAWQEYLMTAFMLKKIATFGVSHLGECCLIHNICLAYVPR